MTYDHAEWHYGGDFVDDVPEENGGTHIGMFLAWAIINNLESEFHQEESSDALYNVRQRFITGRDFLHEYCDEKFWDEDLNELGNDFAKYYYGFGNSENSLYFADYVNVLCEIDSERMYLVEDSWKNYDKLAAIISQRFQEWKLKNFGS